MTTADESPVRSERRVTPKGHPVALVTVNRPKALNALNSETMEALRQTFSDLAADSGARGIVLTGAGDRAFVAGADIGELRDLTPESGRAAMQRGQEILGAVERSEKPVVAAVGGFALGGGLELALACHFRTARPGAKLGLPEVRLGVIPGYGGTQRLPRLIGRAAALRMILSGEPVTAEEAAALGLVDDLDEDPVAGALARLDLVLRNGPLAVRAALAAVDAAAPGEGGLEQGLARERELFASLCGTEDMREGLAAFLEKRSPTFRGR